MMGIGTSTQHTCSCHSIAVGDELVLDLATVSHFQIDGGAVPYRDLQRLTFLGDICRVGSQLVR